EREPASLLDLDLHPERQVAEPSADRTQQEERHDLEDPLAVPGVDVAHVAELRLDARLEACLLVDLARRSVRVALPRLDVALRQDPGIAGRTGASRPNGGEPVTAAHPPYDHASCRKLPPHRVPPK